MDNLQTNKKYFIPMEVTPEPIKAFNINAEDVQWSRSEKLLLILHCSSYEGYRKSIFAKSELCK